MDDFIDKVSSFFDNLSKKLKMDKLPKGAMRKFIMGGIVFLFGTVILSSAFAKETKNANIFPIQSVNAPEGTFALVSIQSDNLKGLKYSALTTQEVKIEDNQQVVTFILSNPQEKLKNFQKDNTAQDLLGANIGAPKYELTTHSVSAQPLKQGEQQITTKSGLLLYKGYSTVDDMNAGQNKSTFAISYDGISKLENGKKIETNVGQIEIKQGE